MVELVRDIRSSVGYGDGEFATFALDCGSEIFRAFINEQKRRIGGYDYVFNTSALKHVRSEKDPYTLMRMIDTNIFKPVSSDFRSRFDIEKKIIVLGVSCVLLHISKAGSIDSPSYSEGLLRIGKLSLLK